MSWSRRKAFEAAVRELDDSIAVVFADRLPSAFVVVFVWDWWIIVDCARLRAMSREEVRDLAAHEVAHCCVWRKHRCANHGQAWRDEYAAALEELE